MKDFKYINNSFAPISFWLFKKTLKKSLQVIENTEMSSGATKK